MRIEIPELCVVALVGASGSGKSTFGKKYFKSTEVLSSDYFRGLVSDDENDQSASQAAFDSLYYIANKRLDAGKLVVIDATNVQKEAREEIVKLARNQDCFPVAIVLDLPEELCQTRNENRADRNFAPYVIHNQIKNLKRSIKHLQKEGFRKVYVLKSPEEIEDIEIVRVGLWTNKKEESGPFDIIGDIHGCYDELCELLNKLGYEVDVEGFSAISPEGRKAIFLGDYCDRGPKNTEVLRFMMNMVNQGNGLCVTGNHDSKLLKKLQGKDVRLSHGLSITIAQLEKETPDFIDEVKKFLDGLISHYVLDDGKLVVAHAGIKEKYFGRSSGRVRNFCLYGDTTGETDEFGLPVRLNWAEEYRGKAKIIYGHVPFIDVQSKNNTFCIDTGCVFGGKLTAYRYPEGEIVQVQAKKTYYEPAKPLEIKGNAPVDMLNIKDVQGKRNILTRFGKRPITIQEDTSIPALEIMSRFAADPHWLIYLPPTMSPCETSKHPEYLEYPLEAFKYFKKNNVTTVVCEQKHMGSRAVIIVCRDEEAAKKRFGVLDGTIGLIYTRTGRHFFEDRSIEQEILSRLNEVLESSHFYKDFSTDWVCIDAELMPWSAKAQKLLSEQYAPVGRAGRDGLQVVTKLLEQAKGIHKANENSLNLEELYRKYMDKKDCVEKYTKAYREYCWSVKSLDDYSIAPFHILATEGKVWYTENHLYHMECIGKYMTGTDGLFISTNHIKVDLLDESSIDKGIDWWMKLTEKGGEGMVVKPLDFVVENEGVLIQPAVKCRGKEYLRIIYGPEYTLEGHLERLKTRSLKKKRRLALNEFSLGMEALERFVAKEPLYRVHECVFGVLAMESESVDPRL